MCRVVQNLSASSEEVSVCSVGMTRRDVLASALVEFLWLIRGPQLHRPVFKTIADLRSTSPPERCSHQ